MPVCFDRLPGTRVRRAQCSAVLMVGSRKPSNNMPITRNSIDPAKFNQAAVLPYELRLQDFQIAMQDVYDFFYDVNSHLWQGSPAVRQHAASGNHVRAFIGHADGELSEALSHADRELLLQWSSRPGCSGRLSAQCRKGWNAGNRNKNNAEGWWRSRYTRSKEPMDVRIRV